MKKIVSLFIAFHMLFFCLPAQAESDLFHGFSDLNLLSNIESNFYHNIVESLNREDCFVENVETIYLSQEYIQELEFNSRSNIFFGYTISELDALFQGQRYFFTMGENNKTVVLTAKEINETYSQSLKNLAVGTGIILICVTISTVSGGLGAPAISMIFAVAAKTSTAAALSGSILGSLSAGIITGMQTGDMNETLNSMAHAGSEGFKWGAIAGALTGGAAEAIGLKGATLHGLTMSEAAKIQKESKYPLDVIKEFQSMKQYEIARDAGLKPYIINNHAALIRDIDLNYVDEIGLTNLQRMEKGLAALDPSTGEAYQLHHIGQRMDSTLAILTQAEHMQNGNDKIWHLFNEPTQIDRNNFSTQRASFWKSLYLAFTTGDFQGNVLQR